ncbi:hypothetical protein F8M41_017628 [Gigaspora margarita]|uniref:Uncharacterized protein n=1 Tax=Gigaspora margarita TaxID=4874 RepID=A0A8H4B2T2_GIGMA|nr:hypothetical protein F8M41_017628 [Gigaspora margarita]
MVIDRTVRRVLSGPVTFGQPSIIGLGPFLSWVVITYFIGSGTWLVGTGWSMNFFIVFGLGAVSIGLVCGISKNSISSAAIKMLRELAHHSDKATLK